jgi:hypothetical protein
MKPGDRPGIPLETEPLVCFQPLFAGNARPGSVQPVAGPPLLEEEPAVWPDMSPQAAEPNRGG